MKKTYWQQGDVLLKQSSLPILGKRVEIDSKILAFGEATGHAHRITESRAKVYRYGNVLYVESPTSFELKHEEHRTLTIPAGFYEVGIVREYDHFEEETRFVLD